MIGKATALSLATAGVLALGYTGAVPRIVSGVTYAVETGKAEAAQEQLQHATWENAFELASQAIQPSVVSITSVRTIHRASQMMPFNRRGGMPDDDFFNRFFEQRGQPRDYRQQGLGSGVIIDKRGYILTNNHVVEQADKLTVHLSDNREVPAKLIGTDPRTDVAVIKIDASGLFPAKIGSSDDLKVGQWVIAVGSPFGLEHTVTSGIVSAKGRENLGVADYEDFIQTDAAINQGNSGGPLVNLHGEVVGINTAILSRSGSNAGVGLAIPIDMARDIMNRLITDGKITRGYVGLAIQDLNPDLAASFEYKKGGGALVGDVVKDGPSAKAGLHSGDIITSMNGKDISDATTFRREIGQTKPGTEVALGVWRDGHEMKLEVKVGEGAGSTEASPALTARTLDNLGIELGDVNGQAAQQFKLPADMKGALITNVDSGSLAEQLGFQAGDVIVNVAGKNVHNAEQGKAEMSKHDLKAGFRIRVQRGDLLRFVFVKEG